MTPEQRHRAAVLEAVAGRSARHARLVRLLDAGAPVDVSLLCALAHLGGCGGSLHADHIVSRQRLKRWTARARIPSRAVCPICHGTGEGSLDELIADGRNGWLVCERHHHNPHITVPREWLPASVEEFARDYRLEWSLDRDYPAAA